MTLLANQRKLIKRGAKLNYVCKSRKELEDLETETETRDYDRPEAWTHTHTQKQFLVILITHLP